jgi:acyl-CoA synthetase (AMP-forming)/AMP-acid ligase II
MWEIFKGNQRFPDRPAVISVGEQTSWSKLYSLSDSAFELVNDFNSSRVGIVCDASPESFAAMAALDRCKANAILLDSGKSVDEINELTELFQLDAIVRNMNQSWDIDKFEESPKSAQPGVTILTSGTTGKPKAARHSWQTLCRPVTSLSKTTTGNALAERWLLTFRPQLYAGLQVTLHAFANAGALIVPPTECDTIALVEFMKSSDVGYVSATPSFWRNVLLNVDAAEMSEIPIRQITLGGELVDQGLLDRLAVTFPNARITHIYATTELGKCFSVTDGQEGFPVSYLERRLPGDVELQISDGQLFVRSENRMLEYDPLGSRLGSAAEPDGWTYTGDLVEVRGERVFFIGRDTDIINVGGYKVNPNKVEQVLREIAEVSNVRVFGQQSSVTGQIVACDVVPTAGTEKETVLQAVRKRAMEQLDRFHRPRIINIVQQIQLNRAGKVKRNDDSS